MKQKDHAHRSNDQAFLEQRPFQVVDRTLDQLGAIIDRHDLGPGRQARGDLGDLGLDVGDHVECVLAEARHDDAGGHLALAVQLGDAAPLGGHQLDAGDVAHPHRRAALGLEHDVGDVLLALQVAATPHHVFLLGELHHPPADVAVGGADGLRDCIERDAVAGQAQRIDGDLVLAHEAADAGDFGHALRLGELVAHVPVLQAAGVGQAHVLAEHRVLVDPAHAGRIRPDLRRDALRQAAGSRAQIFEHARACPVDVGAVLEDHIHVGRAEHREAAHHLGARHRQHRGGERIGDLVLDHLWRLARVVGVDDHLHVREVGQRVERGVLDRVETAADQEQRGQQHQEDIARRPVDHAVEDAGGGGRRAERSLHLNAPGGRRRHRRRRLAAARCR